MSRRRVAIALLVAAALAVPIGMIALVVGFVTSAIAPIYVSIACSVLAAPLLIAGLVVFLTDPERSARGR